MAVGHACQYACYVCFLHPHIGSENGFKFSQLEMSKQSPSFIDDDVLTLFFFFFFIAAEVVLSILIESFEFSPSEKELYWQMSNSVTPTVAGEEMKPQLPMVVKLVQPIV